MNGFGPRPTRRAARGAVPRMAEAAAPLGTRPRPPTPTPAAPLEPVGGERLWQTGTTPTPPAWNDPALLQALAGSQLTPAELAAMPRPRPPLGGSQLTPAEAARMGRVAPRPLLDREQLRRWLLRPGGM
jgi:hypothetical protein